jgi:hypothetical protein
VPTDFFDTFFHDFTADMQVNQAGSQDAPQGRAFFDGIDLFLAQLSHAVPLPYLRHQVLGDYPSTLQGPQSLTNDGKRYDGTQDDWRH